MNYASLLFLVSLLQVGGGGVPGDRVAVPPQTQIQVTAPAISETPVQVTPMTNANQLRFQNGILELPKHNHITLSARERAELMSLRTEQRDVNGNIILDTNGNPVMVPVRQGLNVFRGQVLANFDDRELHNILRINQAQLEVAEAERDKQIEVEHAASALQVAMDDFRRVVSANERSPGVVTAVEVERTRLAAIQAQAYLKLQIYTVDEVRTREVLVRESEMAQTKDQIERRKLVAPIDGMIVKVHASEGEWHREGEPILEIMNLETLWVKAFVPADRYSISDVDGKSATIQVALAHGRVETFPGVVVFCDPTLNAMDQTFEIHIEIQNRREGNHWLLQPGRARVDIVIPL